uniref:RUN and TBC1 domain-containing protein 3 n=1 Tax=Schistocephalus solidus TaxID=70667 RepID=A0A183SRU7_SCHSO
LKSSPIYTEKAARRQAKCVIGQFPVDLLFCLSVPLKIAANLLLFMEEEAAFWMMCSIIEDILPPSYFSADSLIGVQADQRVLGELISVFMPRLKGVIQEHEVVDLALITLGWFLTLFSGVLSIRVMLRVWDLLFYEGSTVLFRIALAILKLNPQNELFSVLDSSTSFSFSSGLQEVIGSTLCLSGADRLIGDRHINDYLHFNDPDSTDPKIKNIRQTELLVNLRQLGNLLYLYRVCNDMTMPVLVVCCFFPQPYTCDLLPNSAVISVLQTAAVQTRRAKALEDFARQETDELGFLRNDIITVLDMHDEHCWLGELNSLRGWFPAKLVELLDERSKCYTPAGDDTVYPDIGHLVRHGFVGLNNPLRAIFEYGLKRTRGLTDTSSSHPWKFIEEVAAVEAARDSSSIHSRLILCRTFRLDEVGKVLSPEELLYRVHLYFHRELVLHLWLEILCSCEEVVTKRYHPWSFLRSPGWVQIKCELRVLSQFAFHLYPLWEITAHLESSKALATYEHKSFHKAKLPLRLLSKLRLGVRPLDPSDSWDFGAFKRDTESTGDMLVKYHLFSWEL